LRGTGEALRSVPGLLARPFVVRSPNGVGIKNRPARLDDSRAMDGGGPTAAGWPTRVVDDVWWSAGRVAVIVACKVPLQSDL